MEQLASRDGDDLEIQCRKTLGALGKEPGLIGTIFRKAQNKLTDPAKLKRIVSLIGSEGPWIGIGVDIKGQIYEGLLERNASEVKSGAGQYFTPRPVIDAIVKCVQPRVGETLCDPACGTGGFLLSAYDFMKTQTHDRDKLLRLRHDSFFGVDIVDEVVRLYSQPWSNLPPWPRNWRPLSRFFLKNEGTVQDAQTRSPDAGIKKAEPLSPAS